MNSHPIQAVNHPVALPVRGYKLSVGALLCLVLQSCTIDEVLPVTWSFSFQCEQDAERTELVELQVGKGSCPLTGSVIFESVKSTWGAPASRPQGLPDGLYVFQGTALDANGKVVASECIGVQVPAKETIALHLQGAAACGSIDEDLDAGPRHDSGTAVDSGGQTPDAGSDAGPPCLDKGDPDSDGVPNCIDECPDDAAKAAEGQCGCGMPETADTDNDGTADCKDNCDADANKIEPGTCGCNPKTTLAPTKGGPNEVLLVGEGLCGPKDDSVRFTMEADGNLHLRVNTLDKWVSVPTAAGLGTKAIMQSSDGNLVIRSDDPGNPSTWASGTTVKSPGTPASAVLSVNADGTVTILRDGSVIWKDGVIIKP